MENFRIHSGDVTRAVPKSIKFQPLIGLDRLIIIRGLFCSSINLKFIFHKKQKTEFAFVVNTLVYKTFHE